jgi:hypothetical protein
VKDINKTKTINRRIYIDEFTRSDHLLFLSLKSKCQKKRLEEKRRNSKLTYKQDLVYQAFVNDYEHYDKQLEIMLLLNPEKIKNIDRFRVLKDCSIINGAQL